MRLKASDAQGFFKGLGNTANSLSKVLQTQDYEKRVDKATTNLAYQKYLKDTNQPESDAAWQAFSSMQNRVKQGFAGVAPSGTPESPSSGVPPSGMSASNPSQVSPGDGLQKTLMNQQFSGWAGIGQAAANAVNNSTPPPGDYLSQITSNIELK